MNNSFLSTKSTLSNQKNSEIFSQSRRLSSRMSDYPKRPFGPGQYYPYYPFHQDKLNKEIQKVNVYHADQRKKILSEHQKKQPDDALDKQQRRIFGIVQQKKQYIIQPHRKNQSDINYHFSKHQPKIQKKQLHLNFEYKYPPSQQVWLFILKQLKQLKQERQQERKERQQLKARIKILQDKLQIYCKNFEILTTAIDNGYISIKYQIYNPEVRRAVQEVLKNPGKKVNPPLTLQQIQQDLQAFKKYQHLRKR